MAQRGYCAKGISYLSAAIYQTVHSIMRRGRGRATSTGAVVLPLEPRRLFAAATVVDGVLNLIGESSTGSQLSVLLDPDGMKVWGSADGVSRSVLLSGLAGIRIYAGNGDDVIWVDPKIPVGVFILADGGNDTITTGAGDDIIRGGPGDDRILAGAGNDLVYGHDGDDTIFGGNGHDTLLGNNGNDTIRGEGGDDLLDGGTGIDNLEGGSGNNTLTNAGASDVPVVVTRFVLYNADTDQPIGNLSSGAVLDLAKLPTRRLSIVALTSGPVASVRFGHNGNTNLRIENGAPFSLAGGIGSNLHPWTPRLGGHSLTATPYHLLNANGPAGSKATVNFSVVDSSTSTPPVTSNGTAAKISRVALPSMVGTTLHVNALSSTLGAGTPLTARYEWDFGDAGSRYNSLEGWNAAHVYDKPGTFTVTLRVTDEAGRSSTASINVQIAPDTRRAIYVSAAGNDAADGSSPDRAVRSVARVNELLGDDTKVLFRRGDTFDVSFQLSIPHKNVLVGAYGTGANPRLRRIADDSSRALINTSSTASRDVTIQDLTLDSQWTSTDGHKIPFNAVWARGSNITVRRNTFLNVNYAVDASSAPTGLLVQDNSAPLATGIRAYFLWLQGTDAVVLGNTVANTTREMVLRAVDYQRLLVAHNDFTDMDRTHLDSKDLANSNLALQQGSWAYVRANRFSTAGIGFGPGTTSTSLPEQRSTWGVFEANRLEDSMLRLAAGAEHSFVRNNVSTISSGPAFFVEGYSTEYNRDVLDATFAHNTATVSGSVGGFLRLWGEARQITVVNNLLLAPNLSASISGAIVSYDPDLSSFKLIGSNVWSIPDSYADRVSYVWDSWYDLRGFKSKSEWNALGPVKSDFFGKLSLKNFVPPADSIVARSGTRYAGVFNDFNGKGRPSSGAQTIGAVQI